MTCTHIVTRIQTYVYYHLLLVLNCSDLVWHSQTLGLDHMRVDQLQGPDDPAYSSCASTDGYRRTNYFRG